MTKVIKKQYIYNTPRSKQKTNSSKREKIGVMIAVLDGDNLKFGWSLMHKDDKKEVIERNKAARKQYGVLKRANPAADITIKIEPVFDKSKAIEIATNRVTTDISSIANQKEYICSEFIRFAKSTMANYYSRKIHGFNNFGF